MNITGSVILGLIYVLPGILFVFGLTRLFSTKTPSPFDSQISTGIVLALPAALLMHAIGIGAANLSSWSLGTPEPDPAQALRMLLSDSRSEAMGAAISTAAEHWFAITIYFLALSICSWRLGKRANRWIKPNRRADWYDLLRREADLLWLTTDMQIGGVAYLFAGALLDFKVSAEGELERVVLTGAVRRTLKRPNKDEMDARDEDYQDGGWIPIPGEHVVLKMSGSHTVNVDYWYLEQEEPDNSVEPTLQLG